MTFLHRLARTDGYARFSANDGLPAARGGGGAHGFDTIPGGVASTEVLSAPGSRSSTIDFAGDTDWFQMTFTAGVRYSIVVTGDGDSALTSPFLQLYSSTGTLITSDADGDWPSLVLIGGGTCFMAVGANGGDVGDYTVTVMSPGQDSIWDGTGTNGALTIDGPAFSSGIETANDRDWFRVELVAGEHYVFSLTGTLGSGDQALSDPYLELRDANGDLIALDDDGGSGTNSLMQFTAVESGVYYLNARAFGLEQVGGYRISAATGAPQNPLDTLDLGFTFDTSDISFYFATTGQTFGPMGQAVQDWTQQQQDAFISALSTLSDVADLSFTLAASANDADFILALTDLEDGVLGQTWINPSIAHIEFAFDTVSLGLSPGGLSYSVFIHEVGHALGLDHPHYDGGDTQVMQGVIDPFDSYGTFLLNQQVFTIMSYNDGWPAGTGPAGSTAGGHASTPMALDIAALQQRYGANTATNAGDTVYTLQGGVGGGTEFVCIWDAGGVDTIRAATFGTVGPGHGAVIDLRDATLLNAIGGGGYVSYELGSNAGHTIAAGVIIENAIGWHNPDSIRGNAANNRLEGRGGDDVLFGDVGSDTLDGGADADTLNGDDGDDLLTGGAGADQLNGGGGLDTADYSNSAGAVRVNLGANQGLDNDAQGDRFNSIEAVIGSAFDDRFTGGAAAETFNGGAGADNALGQSGADALFGEAGNDVLNGGASNDLLHGGDDNDVLVGNTGADQLIGGAGIDTADYSASNGAVRVNLAASQGLDFHAHGDTYDSIEIVIGSNFADRFTGSANGDTFRAGAGADALLGQNGDDVLDGGAGADNLNGGNQNDILIGGAGGDVLAGGTGIDTIDYSASAGGVRVNISANLGLDNDAQGDTFNSVEGVIGSAFNDRFTGATQFADYFHGAGGDDTLLGQAGDDLLYGETGNDTITGGAGSDLLNGGLGADALNGGAGLDTFVFADVLGEGNVDTIAGFSVADDVIHLSTAIFGVGAGALSASAFVIGAAAADADDRIIYNGATGALYYDADGNGAGAAVQFAALSTGLALTNADFFGFDP